MEQQKFNSWTPVGPTKYKESIEPQQTSLNAFRPVKGPTHRCSIQIGSQVVNREKG